MAAQVGIEPTTHGLTVRRSTTDLLSIILATCTGFEPVISAVTGQRIRPTMLTCHIEAHYAIHLGLLVMCFNMVGAVGFEPTTLRLKV